MTVLVRSVQVPFLIAVICCAPTLAYAGPSESSPAYQAYSGAAADDEPAAITSQNGSESGAQSPFTLLTPSREDRTSENTRVSSEPFGRPLSAAQPYEVLAKWEELHSRIQPEEDILAACRSGTCPAAARRFLDIIELGRQHKGRARLGDINRAMNLSIRRMSDWDQYGVDDFWSTPIATMSAGAGDCEDYAIAKYVALRESGIAPDDLRIVIVRDIKRKADHAVVAVHQDEEWLILDNRTMILANAEEARHYHPLFLLDHRGARAFEAALGDGRPGTVNSSP